MRPLKSWPEKATSFRAGYEMKPFLDTLNYSSSNEDGHSEIRALLIKGSESILCITGSGARTLDLLTAGPGEIVSVDFNPYQNFLLELKITAIRHLEYEEFLKFLGVSTSEARSHVYRSIRQLLSAAARSFWDKHPEMIAEGVLYTGRWEKYFRRLERFISLVRPRLRGRLFGSTSIEEQSRIWHGEWENAYWRAFMRLLSSRMLWRQAFGDPGFFLYVPRGFSIYEYLRKRLTASVESMLLKENPFATLLFFGRYEERVLPIYLQRPNYETLRAGLDSITIVTSSLLDYLAQYKNERLDKYSLSDFASYTDIITYENTWKEVVRTASEGARVCERQFLVKRSPPAAIMPFLIRDETIENELDRVDNSIFYSFVVGTIGGSG